MTDQQLKEYCEAEFENIDTVLSDAICNPSYNMKLHFDPNQAYCFYPC